MENCKYLEKQYLNENTADVYFITENNERVPAHKVILSANSLILEEHFNKSADVHIINISNASTDAFKEFLYAFYTKYPEKVFSVENAVTILTLAQTFEFRFCIYKYEQFLMKNLTIDTICFIYIIAKRFELVELELYCAKQINATKNEVFESAAFLNCDSDMVDEMLKCITIRSCDELKIVWDGCMKWAENQCYNFGMNLIDMKNCRKSLGKCFNTMCFIIMHDIALLQYATERYVDLFKSNELEDVQPLITANSEYDEKQIESVPDLVFTRFRETMLATMLCRANDVISIELKTTEKIILNGIALASVIGQPNGKIDICTEDNESFWIANPFEVLKGHELKNFIPINGVVLEPNQVYKINMQLAKDVVFYRSRLISNTYQTGNRKISLNVRSGRDIFSHLVFSA